MAGRTQDEWFRLIAEYQRSNETMRAFCLRNSISDSALYYWLAKTKKNEPAPIKMLQVVSAEAKPINVVELVMPKGFCLRFSPDASAHYIAGIIKALV